MPQGNVPQYSGHNYTTTETGIKYRTLNGGNPLSHDDVDANYDILRKAINGLVADIGLASTTSSTGIGAVQADLTTAESTLTALQSTVTALQTEVSGIETNVTNITNGTTTITWDQIIGAPDQLDNADTNGATFGDVVNAVPAIDLTYPAGPRIRGGVQGVTIVDDVAAPNAGWSGLTARSFTMNAGSLAVPAQASTLFFNGPEGATIAPVSNGQAYIQGDLKIQGKIICDDLEDSTGNTVGGAGAWPNHWLDINVPSAAKHFGSSGTGVYDVNFHTHVPGALEVFIEAHMGEAYLQYWNVYTGAHGCKCT